MPSLKVKAQAERERRRRKKLQLSFTDWLIDRFPTWEWMPPHLVEVRDRLQDVTDGKIRRLMLFMPPRHGKSEMLTVRFSAWTIEQDPTKRVIIGAYNQTLANKFSRKARKIATERVDISRERTAVDDWETVPGGGLRAVGVGAGVTGMGGNLIVIDDPVKNREEAASETYRNKVWDWYTDDLYTRQEPGAAIVLIMCMTGDTPVLMADGTELPLREIKAGDRVATYDKGKLRTSTVRNHTSKGTDFVYEIRMTCGKIVHANERHPFLVEEHGDLKWLRLKNLTTAHKIVTVKDNGVNGRAKPAPLRVAKNLLVAGDTASHTIAKRCGLTGIARRRSTKNIVETYASSRGTELPLLSTMQFWQSKGVDAPSANSPQQTMYERIGAANCASITAMTRTQSEGFYATTVISPWDMPSQKQPHSPWPNTSDFTTEPIASIEPAGIEEVFDIQIERTENFIANGLVSHNTRWHEDDLAGRILNSEDAGSWTMVKLPALAMAGDTLGRQVGEPLWPGRFNADALANFKTVLGRSFHALYQQEPQEQEGEFFKRSWFQPVNSVPAEATRVRYWDKGATVDGDPTTGVLMARHGGLFYVEDVKRGWWTSYERNQVMLSTAQADGASTIIHVEQEPGSSGIDSIQEIVRLLAGYGIRADRVTGPKEVRAEPFAAQAEAGNVRMKLARWNEAYIDELTSFPNGKHDDQVDASSGAFLKLTVGTEVLWTA